MYANTGDISTINILKSLRFMLGLKNREQETGEYQILYHATTFIS